MNPSKPKLIHVASIQFPQQQLYLLLRQVEPFHYLWFHHNGLEKVETSIWGRSAEEALLAAYRFWKFDQIRTLHCGFRYTLPERDEVGTNALFHHMASSYSSMSGIYFDEELGFNCIVHQASLEARALLRHLQQLNQL